MFKLVKTYLLQNKSVSIPGLGTIYVERIPAQSDFVNRQLLPPSYHYRFDRYFDTPDKEFFTFLSARKNVQDYEAIRLFNEWALEFRNSLGAADHKAELEGIGTVTRNSSGDISFEPFGKPRSYDMPISAERIIRTNAKHVMLVGDKETTNVEMSDYYGSEETHKEKVAWWIYALIIAAIAVIIIFFNYYRNGASSPFGNQQKIEVK